ncbi:MAG TPA: hypothetical protein VM822_16085 [Pseudolabrys sp.]|jgi:hypothetical protein|nr:hypothetical protein [Pseudolabrys sp.]
MIDDIHRAMDLMRKPGRHLIQTHGGRWTGWTIAPDGRRVTPEIAAKIREHPQVVGNEDSLWPGLSQTWRMK